MPPSATVDASARTALRRRGFLLTTWPWRALAHTATTVVVWVVFAIPAVVVVTPFGGAVDQLTQGAVVAAAGLLLLGLALGVVLLPLVGAPLVALDRWRALLVEPAPLPVGPRPPSEPLAWIRDRWWTVRRWREAGYVVAALCLATVVIAVVGVLAASAVGMLLSPLLASADDPVNVGPWQVDDPRSAVLVAVLGLVLLAVTAYAWTVGACLQTGLLRRTLESGRQQALAEELVAVDASRNRLVESFDSERRRIERDLHDGAQQRLVTLAMGLGVTRLEVVEALGADHPASVGVTAAHEQAKVLMDELRAFVRGIHPKVLTDVGLVAALDQLAASMPLPVAVTSTLHARPAARVESTAYFATSEALTNVVRHSDAKHATVAVGRDGDDVVVEVSDDGVGGAAARPDSGLTWMADRVAAVGGTLAVVSPPGGPTVVRMRIPETR